MKTFKLLAIALFVFVGTNVQSQDINLKWGKAYEINNSKNGNLSDVIGQNDKYIYGMFLDLAGRGKKRKLVAFDKNSMSIVKEAGLKGFKENKKDKKLKKKLSYYRTVIYDEVIYAFWEKSTKTANEIYVESFNSDLKKISSIKKIYQLKKDKKADKFPESFILSNRDVKGGKILIGGELAGYAGEQVKVEFKELNKDLSFSNSVQLELPFAKISEKKKLFKKAKGADIDSYYSFGDDGFLHIRTSFSYTRKQIKKMKKAGTFKTTPTLLYSSVDLKDGKLSTKELKFEGKKLLSTVKSIENNVVKLFGFFSDTKKDESGTTTHGLFYTELNSDYSVKKVKFNYFTKKQLKELFKNDTENRYARKSCNACNPGKGCFGKGKDNAQKADDDAAIADDYEIDYSINSSDAIYMFCSRARRYSVEHCSTDPKTHIRTCHTTYHLNKSNFTAFKLDANGVLGWSSNLDRFAAYSSRSSSIWDIEDVHVVMEEDGFYVIYDEIKSRTKDEKKAGKEKWDKKRRPFTYAFFDINTGKYSKRDYNVNSVNVKKKQRRTVLARNVFVMDNQFYVHDARIWRKPIYWLMFWMVPPNALKGLGYVGKIETL